MRIGIYKPVLVVIALAFLLVCVAPFALTQSPPIRVGGTPDYCADAGSTDAYACSLSPAIAAYTNGASYRFKANTANTGAATLALNGLTATAIVKYTGGVASALADNDIRAGQIVTVVYDGTNFQLASMLGNGGAGGTTYTFRHLLSESGGTVDYDTIDARYFIRRDEWVGNSWVAANINGTGSSAVVAGSVTHPGVMRSTSGATSGNMSGWYSYSSSLDYHPGQIWNSSMPPFRFVAVWKMNSTTQVRFFVGGQTTNNVVEAANRWGMRYDLGGTQCSGADTTNWTWVFTQSAGGSGCVDTGVAADTNWHTTYMWRDTSANNKLWMQLDDGTPVSFCPSGCTVNSVTPSASNTYTLVIAMGTNEAVAKSVDVDYTAYDIGPFSGATRTKRP
jgi:hypothetical protein